jgi:hypothetical protein
VIPVIIQVTGTISKSFRRYLKNIKWQQQHQGNRENNYFEHWAHISESSTNAKHKEFSQGIVLQAQYIFNTA